MFGKNNKTANLLDQAHGASRITEYEIRFDKESICLPLSRYEELIRAEAERDIIARAAYAEPSYAVSSIVKAVATVHEGTVENKTTEAPKTPEGANSEDGDA